MIGLEEYRENARKNNLCQEYTDIWDSCKNNKQVFDMAVGAKGVDYLCDTIAKGWGISPSVISERFRPFINGRYISKQNGYTSSMYCEYKGEFTASTEVLAIIKSDVVISIPKNMICEIYTVGVCKIKLTGEGRCVVISYGDENDALVESSCSNMKRIYKKERDHYGD